MEDLVLSLKGPAPTATQLAETYKGKRVLVTGHTGFKGGWLSLWLAQLGAEVTGFALPPETRPSLFDAIELSTLCRHVDGDVRDFDRLRVALREARPEFVFHLASQALVHRSYEEPLATIGTNILGTAHLLEAIRLERLGCAVVVVTSDKCYENREWLYGYRENDPMGGHDVYSMTKGAVELLVSSYRRSFFPPARLDEHGVALASARAGNVIGGGDWALERVVPDCMTSLAADRPVLVRNPNAVRPWQHVIEPLAGYLLLGSKLNEPDPRDAASYCEAWNFGPRTQDAVSVHELVSLCIGAWGAGQLVETPERSAPHEARLLRLSIEKAETRMGWMPRWPIAEAVSRTVAWYRAHARGEGPAGMRALAGVQIAEYVNGAQWTMP